MRLSEAIRLGSLLVNEPKAGRLPNCALGMGMAAIGKPINDPHAIHYEMITSEWPWLRTTIVDCPICGERIGGGECLAQVVWHPFDAHVVGFGRPRRVEMTIEQLADFIASIEPKEDPVPSPSPSSPAPEFTQISPSVEAEVECRD